MSITPTSSEAECDRVRRLTSRKEWIFFSVLPKATCALLPPGGCPAERAPPAAFAIAMGVLVGAVQRASPGQRAGGCRRLVALQVLSPIHHAISENSRSNGRVALRDRLTESRVEPPGIGHLDPTLTRPLSRATSIWDDGSAPVHFHGVHRERYGRDDRRPGLRYPPRPPRGGRRSCSRAPGWRRTGSYRERDLGWIAIPTRARSGCGPCTDWPRTARERS
jgi:hypothetical protein